MARYIDAEKIPYIDLNDDMPQSKIRVYIAFKERIDQIPSADVRENIKGKWIESSPNIYTKRVNCSNCGSSAPFVFVSDGDVYSTNGNHGEIRKTNYCPNCGADMRGDNNG